MLVQSLEQVEDFPNDLSTFFKAHADCDRDKLSRVFLNATKAILLTFPGLYRETIQRSIQVLQSSGDVIERSLPLLVEDELKFYATIHPLQPSDESYASPLLTYLVQSASFYDSNETIVRLL